MESPANLDRQASLELENLECQECQGNQGAQAYRDHPEIRVPAEERAQREQLVRLDFQDPMGCPVWVNPEGRAFLVPRA